MSLTGCWREFSYKSPSRFLVSSTIETYDLRKAKLLAKFKAGMPFKFPKLHRVRLCNFPRNVSDNSTRIHYKPLFIMACKEGQFDVVKSDFYAFSINLNVQHVYGMAPFDMHDY